MDGNGINARLLQFYCLLKYLCSSLIDQNTQRPVCQAAAAAREAAQGEDPGPEENSQPGLRRGLHLLRCQLQPVAGKYLSTFCNALLLIKLSFLLHDIMIFMVNVNIVNT